MSDRPWPPRTDDDYHREALEMVGPDLVAAFARVEAMVFDADGVLTGGNLLYGVDGEALKEFHSQDGLGLVMARVTGIKLGVLTGRQSAIVGTRCRELKFHAIQLGRFDKQVALAEIAVDIGIDPDRMLYMGDDVLDLPAMRAVGLPVATPEAPDEVQDECAYVTDEGGGRGAVREVVDLVLKSRRLYGEALRKITENAWKPGEGE